MDNNATGDRELPEAWKLFVRASRKRRSCKASNETWDFRHNNLSKMWERPHIQPTVEIKTMAKEGNCTLDSMNM